MTLRLSLLGWMLWLGPALLGQNFAFVANTQSHDIYVYRLDGTILDTIPVGNVPVDIAVSPDSTLLAVTNAVDGTIMLIDVASRTVVDTLTTGTLPSDAVFNAAGTQIYQSFLSQNKVEAFNLNGSVTATISFSGGPTDMALRPGTNDLYVLKSSLGEMGIIDLSTNTVAPTNILLEGLSGGNSTNPFSLAISNDGTKAVVPNSSSFYSNLVDLTNNTVSRVQEFGFDAFMSGPIGVAITPDGTQALISEESAGELSVIDLATGGITSTISLGFTTQPIGIATNQAGDTAFVTLTATNQIAVVDLGTGTFSLFSAGTAPRDVVIVGVTPCPVIPLTQVTDSVCDDALPYQFGTQLIQASGTYYDTLQVSAGCDSTVELTLTVLPTFQSSTSAFICQGQSLNFGTQVLLTAGTYTEIFSAANGCDSTVTLTLSVGQSSQDTTTIVICEDTLPYQFGGQALTNSGIYVDSLLNNQGCDSILVLDLTVNPTYVVNDSAFICQGQTLQFGTQILDSSGVYTEVFLSQAGCDSTVTLTLSVGNLILTQLSNSICQGDSIPFGGQNLTSAGIYLDSLIASIGCDSIVELTLTVNDTFRVQIADTICENAIPYSFGAQSLDSTGVYMETFVSTAGCDSTVILSLMVQDTFLVQASQVVCQNQIPVLFGSQQLDSTGVYTEVFNAANGCDSTVILTLTLVDTSMNQIQQTLCADELPLQFGTQMLDSAGTYQSVFTNTAGCDSVVTLVLTISDTFRIQASDMICENELPYRFGSQNLMMEGTFSETFTALNGCDSTVDLTLVVHPVFDLQVLDTIRNGESLSFGTQTLTTAGMYTETFVSTAGCDSVVTLTLTVLPGLGIGALSPTDFGFSIYPNPANETLSIRNNKLKGESITISLWNELGQMVTEKTFAIPQGPYFEYQLATQQLAEGIYHLVIAIDGQITQTKLLIFH